MLVELIDKTIEEVAAAMSQEEGHPVTVLEVRRLECQALRKLRRELERRGLTPEVLIPAADRWR